MEKVYFIKKNVNNSAKNKLDAKLHETFLQLNYKTITEDNLFILDVLFDDTVAAYKATGGRCEAPKYTRQTHAANYELNPIIYVHVSESCSYILYPILGEATIETVKQ